MKKVYRILVLIVIAVLISALFFGCSEKNKTLTSVDEGFAFSYGIDKDGFWENVKALKSVELCNYTGIIIPKDIHEIPNTSIQAEIDSLLSGFEQDIQVTDRKIMDGDTVNIDYTGSIDGVPFSGGSTQDSGTDVTIGVTNYIDDFLEQLIGHTPGESFDIEVTFPDDYSKEELKGKDAVFAITLNYIVESISPELTDDFVTENLAPVYNWSTVSEMQDFIGNKLQESAIEYFLQDYIAENSSINSLPEILVEYQEFSMIQYYKDYAKYYSMEYEEFLSASTGAATTDELLELNLAQNTKTANLFLLIQAIAEDVGITVSDDDAIAYFSEISESGDHSDYEAVYGMPHLKLITLQRAVIDYIKDSIILE